MNIFILLIPCDIICLLLKTNNLNKNIYIYRVYLYAIVVTILYCYYYEVLITWQGVIIFTRYYTASFIFHLFILNTNQQLISSIPELPPGCAIFCYMLDAQLFLWSHRYLVICQFPSCYLGCNLQLYNKCTLYYLLFNTVYIKNSPTCFELCYSSSSWTQLFVTPAIYVWRVWCV
jgi:hypothetical protein